MKNNVKSLAAFLLVVLCFSSLCACTSTESPNTDTTVSEETDETTTLNGIQLPPLWENAIYTEDKEFGNGSKTLTVEVTAEEKTVVFTVNTDKETVGEALIEHNLIAGDEGEYGLYIKSVNGITADYSVDQNYWAFYIGDDYAATGVDMTEITAGATYKLIRTK